jgi:Protein of unknown function (DUF4240)
MTLTINEFWAAIESTDKSALDNGEETLALKPLAEALASFSLSELEEFEQYLHEVLFAIDGEDFFDESGETSGDVFLYCRCYVVAKGHQFYSEVLHQPALMPNQDCESLLYVASQAWASKTGNEANDWSFIASVNYETGCNSSRWSTQKPIKLTPEQFAEQHERNYQRALSSVVHAYRAGRFKYVEELLTPYRDRLSMRFFNMLQEAKLRAGPS